MAFFGLIKDKPVMTEANVKAKSPSSPVGDLALVDGRNEGFFKSYIPGFLYKPPFGYPREENLPLIRQMAKNPYVFSIIKSITDAVACTEWDIVQNEDVEMNETVQQKIKDIKNFFKNPNGNMESFSDILRALTRDILEIDSGVVVKVFNAQCELVQIFARDGASFLKNPNIYGYIGDRADVIEPVSDMELGNMDEKEAIHFYDLHYKDNAAYFQYGWTSQSMPIPFGRNEVMYIMQNPRTDSIYGQSPVAMLADIVLTLVYGSQYNLDFYMNNNMPEGIMSIVGASQTELQSFKERFESQFRKQDEITGFWRKIGFKFPFTNRQAEFIPFQLDPKTMQVIEQQSWFTKIAWACFGLTADEMGFTENSNRATSEQQSEVGKRKAVKPILQLIEYHINQQIIPELDPDVEVRFKFDDYDIDAEMKKYDLYMKQQQLGVMTPEMIAEEEGLDVAAIQEAQEEKKEMERMQITKGQEQPTDGKKAEMYADEEEEQAYYIGDTVRVISGSESRMDQIGVIEDFTGEDTVIVRFEVGKDIFSVHQLVLIETESPTSEIKAKDPFNNTDLERQMMKDIFESGKKVRRALQKYKGGTNGRR